MSLALFYKLCDFSFPQPKYNGPKYSIVLTIDKLSSNEPTTVVISSPLMVRAHEIVSC